MATSIPKKPWVIAGGLSFAALELAGIIYALVTGRMSFSLPTLKIAVTLTIAVGLLGLVFGIIFVKYRNVIWFLNIYIQSFVAFVLMGAVVGVLSNGVGWLATDDFIVSCVMSVGAGPLFAYLGLRFGGER